MTGINHHTMAKDIASSYYECRRLPASATENALLDSSHFDESTGGAVLARFADGSHLVIYTNPQTAPNIGRLWALSM